MLTHYTIPSARLWAIDEAYRRRCRNNAILILTRRMRAQGVVRGGIELYTRAGVLMDYITVS